MKSTGTLARLVEGSMDSEAWRAAGCAIRLCPALSAVAPSAAVMEQNSLLDRCFMLIFVSLSLFEISAGYPTLFTAVARETAASAPPTPSIPVCREESRTFRSWTYGATCFIDHVCDRAMSIQEYSHRIVNRHACGFWNEDRAILDNLRAHIEIGVHAESPRLVRIDLVRNDIGLVPVGASAHP